MSADDMSAAILSAWSTVPAPPLEDLQDIAWAWSEKSWNAFAGVAPTDIDVGAAGFLGCTPLNDLPPRAAAAYLGTYLLGLINGLKIQDSIGVFPDIMTRSHVLACLLSPDFWQRVIRPHLNSDCKTALAELAVFLEARRSAFALTDEQAASIVELAAAKE